MSGPGWRAVAAVSLGGLIGSLARFGLDQLWGQSAPSAWPWSTFTVNVVGCLLIGVLAGVLARLPGAELARAFLGVGVLGGFTTFSAFAVQLHGMADAGAWGTALGYVVASVLGGLGAVLVGLALGRRAPWPAERE